MTESRIELPVCACEVLEVCLWLIVARREKQSMKESDDLLILRKQASAMHGAGSGMHVFGLEITFVAAFRKGVDAVELKSAQLGLCVNRD